MSLSVASVSATGHHSNLDVTNEIHSRSIIISPYQKIVLDEIAFVQ